ncbi:MAG: GNAT family N-acetyltransferase [Pseudomonadota bacterium]
MRTATGADVPAIDRLLSRSYRKLLRVSYPPSLQVMAIPLISRANPKLITSGTYFVTESPEGQIVGVGGWTRSVKGLGIADVRHLATDPDHAREGVARRTMLGIIDDAKVAGARVLESLATRNAVPFYEAMGFGVERDVTIGLRPGIDFPVVRMSRRI